jgi:hypothetical protein
MYLLHLLDFSQLSDLFFIETSTPSTPVEFVQQANKILSDSFQKFATTIQIIVGAFAIFGILLTALSVVLTILFNSFGKSLREAKKEAKEEIRAEVNKLISEQLTIEIENTKKTLERERIISEAVVDYFFPFNSSKNNEYNLLKQRGFKEVRFWNNDKTPIKPLGDVFILDLENIIDSSGRHFSELLLEEREEEAKEHLTKVLDWMNNTTSTVLVVYVRERVKAINDLLPKGMYYTPANTPVTLMGAVADSAYVAYGEKNKKNK